MSKYSDEKLYEIDVRIRRLKTTNPNMSALQMAEVLKLTPNFVAKRKKRIDREDAEAIKRITVEEDLADIRNFLNAVLPEISRFVFDQTIKPKDRINAVKVLIEGKIKLLNSKFDAGVFEKQLGKLKTEDRVSEEERKVLLNAFDNAFRPKDK